LGMAYAKAQMAAKPALPMQGNVFISVKDRDKTIAVDVAQDLVSLGFKIYSTSGTTAVLEENGIEVSPLFRIGEGRPTVIDMLKNGKIDMIVNTPAGQLPRKHENAIRTEAVLRNVCIMTSMTSAQAAVNGIRALKKNPLEVKCLQLYAADLD